MRWFCASKPVGQLFASKKDVFRRTAELRNEACLRENSNPFGGGRGEGSRRTMRWDDRILAFIRARLHVVGEEWKSEIER